MSGPDDPDKKFDFSDEEPTVPDHTTMHVLMQSMMDEEHETILLAVPESGRFSFAFAHLTVVAPPARSTH